jgi:hypothetical protein
VCHVHISLVLVCVAIGVCFALRYCRRPNSQCADYVLSRTNSQMQPMIQYRRINTLSVCCANSRPDDVLQ